MARLKAVVAFVSQSAIVNLAPSFRRRMRMSRKMKALMILSAGAVVLSGCGSGSWLKWFTVASQLGFNFTGMLDNLGILTG
jgi:hypothetical protein